MWRRVVLDVLLPHPAERVYPLLADPARWPDFAPAVAFRQRIGDGTPDVGSRWWAVDRIGPFRVRFADVLESIEPGERVVWHSTSPWNSRVMRSSARGGLALRNSSSSRCGAPSLSSQGRG